MEYLAHAMAIMNKVPKNIIFWVVCSKSIFGNSSGFCHCCCLTKKLDVVEKFKKLDCVCMCVCVGGRGPFYNTKWKQSKSKIEMYTANYFSLLVFIFNGKK